MPYLNDSHKQEIEKVCDFDHSAAYLASGPVENFAGAINYVNYVIARKRFSKGSIYRKYFQMAAWTGTLILCILEVWKRVICDYELEKIAENGDVDADEESFDA